MWLFVYLFYGVLLLGIMESYQANAIAQLLYADRHTNIRTHTHNTYIHFHNELRAGKDKRAKCGAQQHGTRRIEFIPPAWIALSGCNAFHSEVCHKAKQFFVLPAFALCPLLCARALCTHSAGGGAARKCGDPPCRACQPYMNALAMRKRSLNI